MSDIRQWLEELGLGQYADAFVENEIERDILLDITDQTLKDIGVSVAGHRIRILKAITALSEPTDREESAEGLSPVDLPPERAVVPDAERRNKVPSPLSLPNPPPPILAREAAADDPRFREPGAWLAIGTTLKAAIGSKPMNSVFRNICLVALALGLGVASIAIFSALMTPTL